MLVIRLCLNSEPISLYPEWARTPSVRTDTDTDLRAQPPPHGSSFAQTIPPPKTLMGPGTVFVLLFFLV